VLTWTSTGHCPVEEFLDALSGKQAQKVVWVLRLLVLTHGFAKKSDKIPRREIELAETRRREYLTRRPLP
jgi:Gp49-like protein DUF891